MHRIPRNDEKPSQLPSETELAIPIGVRTPSPRSVAAFSAELKGLTNYEVWKRVESMILTLTPGQEAESDDWWRFRLLLDELQWRLSGLEGARSSATRIRLAA